jgi:hypothetical protein
MRVRRSSLVGCANAVIPATSGRPESDGAGRFTTKAPRHQGKIHREDGEVREKRALLWEASPDADTAEGREKNIHHRDHRGHRGKMFTTEAQRHREALRGKDARAKRQGHGEKRAVACGLSVLDLGRP